MIKNDEKKTTVKQRIVIIAIAVGMLGATFALYAGIVLGNMNQAAQNEVDSEKEQRFQELYAEYSEKVEAQSKELSGKYFDTFVGYKSRVKAFNAADVNTLSTKDLKVGSGAEVTDSNYVDYAAYYVGWLSDGTVFDSSFNDPSNPSSLSAPLEGSVNMIQGWLDGIVGMKIGGVREITIPSVLAYGDQEQGKIPANSPLKFVVMLIEKPEEIEISEELESLYGELYGYSI